MDGGDGLEELFVVVRGKNLGYISGINGRVGREGVEKRLRW